MAPAVPNVLVHYARTGVPGNSTCELTVTETETEKTTLTGMQASCSS